MLINQTCCPEGKSISFTCVSCARSAKTPRVAAVVSCTRVGHALVCELAGEVSSILRMPVENAHLNANFGFLHRVMQTLFFVDKSHLWGEGNLKGFEVVF